MYSRYFLMEHVCIYLNVLQIIITFPAREDTDIKVKSGIKFLSVLLLLKMTESLTRTVLVNNFLLKRTSEIG